MTERKLIFITGASRSGTTLLSFVLRNHPAVFGLKELQYFGQAWDPRDSGRRFSRTEAIEAAATMLACQEQGVLAQKVGARAPEIRRRYRRRSRSRRIRSGWRVRSRRAAPGAYSRQADPVRADPAQHLLRASVTGDLSGCARGSHRARPAGRDGFPEDALAPAQPGDGRQGGASLRSVACLDQLPPLHRGPFVGACNERGVRACGASACHVGPVRGPGARACCNCANALHAARARLRRADARCGADQFFAPDLHGRRTARAACRRHRQVARRS